MNALRFIRYSLLVLLERRGGRHARRCLSETAKSALALAGFVTMPLWLILAGVI